MQIHPENAIARQVVSLLHSQGLKAGDRLPGEIELAETLKVSRPALREAMGVLESTGLLATRKGSGRVLLDFNFATAIGLMTRYITPQRKWLLDLLAVRQLLENNTLPIAAVQYTPADFELLDVIVLAMEDKAARGAYFGDEDRRFHLALYSNVNNEVLNGILEVFWTLYGQLDVEALSHSQRLDETAAHHRRIVNALKAGDVRRAQHHLDTHFYDTGFTLSQGAEGAGNSQT